MSRMTSYAYAILYVHDAMAKKNEWEEMTINRQKLPPPPTPIPYSFMACVFPYPNIDIFVSPDVSLTPEQESVFGRTLLAILFLFIHIDLNFLNLQTL